MLSTLNNTMCHSASKSWDNAEGGTQTWRITTNVVIVLFCAAVCLFVCVHFSSVKLVFLNFVPQLHGASTSTHTYTRADTLPPCPAVSQLSWYLVLRIFTRFVKFCCEWRKRTAKTERMNEICFCYLFATKFFFLLDLYKYIVVFIVGRLSSQALSFLLSFVILRIFDILQNMVVWNGCRLSASPNLLLSGEVLYVSCLGFLGSMLFLPCNMSLL